LSELTWYNFITLVLFQDKTSSDTATTSTAGIDKAAVPPVAGTDFSSIVQLTLALDSWWKAQKSRELFRGKNQPQRRLLRKVKRITLGAAAVTVLSIYRFKPYLVVPAFILSSFIALTAVVFNSFFLFPLILHHRCCSLGRVSVYGDRWVTCSCARATATSSSHTI